MFSLLKKNSAFFIPYLLFLLIGGTVLICYKKIDIALFINKCHNPSSDFFFSTWTNIGLGYLLIPVALMLAFVSLRYFIMSLITFLLSFGINDSIKFIIGAPRPQTVLGQLHISFYHVPGVDIYSWDSFPSGHTAISFGMFCLLALMTKNQPLKLLCFVTAFLVAYSRMYLSEHFLIDVYTASFIGSICALLTFNFVANWKWLNKFAAIDKPIFRI